MNETLPDTIRPIRFDGGALYLLDQRRLPGAMRENRYDDAGDVAAAIRDMVVRGAPAIGIAAAFAVVLACRSAASAAAADWRAQVERAIAQLEASRPTAVNLFWALDRMRAVLAACPSADEAEVRTLAEAQRMLAADIAANRRLGAAGAELIEPGRAVLTHCNTGSLATGGFGTALGVIRSAWAQGRIREVFADETRPWLQGARLTAWELLHDGIPVHLLCEGAAASLLRSGQVGWVIVGADRIAANGDTANKIGTYGLALLAREHGVRFMVAAPVSTIDFDTADGSGIPIEMRPESEVLELGGRAIAPPGARGWNPAFDVTPARLIDAIVTELGVVQQPDRARLAALREPIAAQ
ncbi:S-methyl-5-thioribose-1-phosphate isomerase [Thioalkalivibrio paradoxus]|uniref:Methylthioribose-1-phosphate isomerase n=1 Tax=Thioalkalivibrio paradoxus ARh 1 TaxID=713585 RepID=W0DIH5_9GAMM|nr:S-methyl-5-thioribose-1-phosphate isomerase [Thioalkalivibrio paradoxus]AHE98201.1 methylthioribose-1-phosphate isomerase [Thioalkalivibrio paradoxus ARh 1]